MSLSTRRWLQRVVCAILAATSLAGCASRDAATSHRPKVRIAFRSHFTLAPIFIAKAESLYARQGLDVELVPIDAVSSSVPALLQGQIDVLPGPVSPSLFNAIARGGRLRIVADKGTYFRDDCPEAGLVMSPEFARRGGMPRRLSTAKETFNQRFDDLALRARGTTLDAVEQFHLPDAAEYNALIGGRIDMAHMGSPWLDRALAQGAVLWRSTNELLPGNTYSVIVYGTRLLDRDPDIGRRVALANLEAMRLYNQGKTERNLAIVAGALGLPSDAFQDVCWSRMREDGQIDTTGIIAFERWAHEHGQLDTVLSAASFWDPRFVEAARAALSRAP